MLFDSEVDRTNAEFSTMPDAFHSEIRGMLAGAFIIAVFMVAGLVWAI